ncbi:hypothetical protein BGZ83_006281 [Gryganskiella cystojenkinii]|nr:hypothetical protein BGZ83_006281 [Gryganskiella cystojenkinii]
MASLRSIAWIMLLLAALCSTVLCLSNVQPEDKVDIADVVLKNGYALLNQPAFEPAHNSNINNNNKVAMAPNTVYSQSSFTDFFSENYNRINVPLTWQRVISGGVLLAVGLILGLFGFRYLRFSLLLTGFIGGGIAAFAILTNTEPAGLWSNRILIYVAVCIAAGLLVGLVMLGLNKYASWILGGAGGLALGVYILSWREGGLIHNTAGRIGLMAGAAALGMLLSTFLGSLTVIFATVLVGGYMFTLGLDMFLRTGFLENYKNLFRTGNTVPYTIYSGIYGMLGVLSLMFLLGYLFQIPLYFNYKRRQRKLARASAVPSVNGPYGYNSNRNSQYGTGSHYGGSQYGSRDQLNTPYGSQPVKKEYNWWGKRVNKDAPLNNNRDSYYSDKQYQQSGHVQAQQPIVQQQPVAIQQPAVPTTTTTQAGGDKTVIFEEKKDWLGRTKVVPKIANNRDSYHSENYQQSGHVQAQSQNSQSNYQQPIVQQQQPIIQQQPAVVQQSAVPSTTTTTAQSVPHLGSTTTSVGGDKPVIFKEKKNWLGRKKIVPTFADASTASTSTAGHNVAATGTTTYNTAAPSTHFV